MQDKKGHSSLGQKYHQKYTLGAATGFQPTAT